MITDLNEANDLILRRISEVPEKTILGFLPLSESEQMAVIRLVREALSGSPPISIGQLLRTQAGATCYALMLARSISELPGGQFWPCVEEKLGLRLSPPEQQNVSSAFILACSRLGIFEGTIENVGWVHAAPLIFQGGILHYWRHSLAEGLRRTLTVLPAPDLDDEAVVSRFVRELQARIVNQPILIQALNSPIGPLLVRRLMIAYLKNDDSALPSHLREPMRAAFEGVGRGAVLRGPYLAFDPVLDEIELVLPTQSNRISTPDTRWVAFSRPYAARSEARIPLSEIESDQFTVSLKRLLGSYQDQEFQIDARLDDTVPFRIFREDTLRERKADAGTSCQLPAGDYLVVMAPDVAAGEDDAEVQDINGYRVLRHLELRPGDEPLVLNSGDRSWEISCELQSGVFVDRDRGSSIRLDDGELLHYGPSVGLVAYFPANGEIDPRFPLKVSCSDLDFSYEDHLESSEENNRVYLFTENLRERMATILSNLPAGIHRINLTLSHADRRLDHSFLYWRGLERIDESRGFVCSQFPANVDLKNCLGVARGKGEDLVFVESYHRPFIRLSVIKPQADLTFPRAGVQVVLITPNEDWEEEPSADEPVIVAKDDKRVLRFTSGGFQEWEIRCGHSSIRTLNSRRSSFAISLAGLCRTNRGSGSIFARREDGKEVKLLTFSMPLTASSPKFSQDHGMAMEEWSFNIPTEDLFEVAVRITDLSDHPDAPPSPEQTLVSASEGFADFSYEVIPGLSVRAGRGGEGESDLVKFVVRWKADSIQDHLLIFDFVRRGSPESPWVPLRCVERQGYSHLRIIAMGSSMPEETATWWKRLRCARRGDANPELARNLGSLDCMDLDKGLQACQDLLAWKYPGSVWSNCANRFQNLATFLGRYRFNVHDESAATWWEHSTFEVCEYASFNLAPVVKQFLFGSQPSCLRIPPGSIRIGQGKVFASPLGRSFNLAAEIQGCGGLLYYVPQTYHSKDVDSAAFHSFPQLSAVSRGQSKTLGRFNFQPFLQQLYKRTEEAEDSTARIEVESLLSPEHLEFCIRGINRRCHLIGAISETGQHHILAGHAQTIELVHQHLEQLMPAVSRKLGINQQFQDPYDTENYLFWWKPPCLKNRWGQKVAEIVWALAAIARLAAHHQINPDQFEKWLADLCGSREEAKIRSGICTLLSLAPELFAFYVALFDLALAELQPN
ncbi:MAG: hypothetical protein JNK37_14815 [Verrucomicrobiales bacterium]|nr:hypothetical protein [Verrucomicrobiales bacterium]